MANTVSMFENDAEFETKVAGPGGTQPSKKIVENYRKLHNFESRFMMGEIPIKIGATYVTATLPSIKIVDQKKVSSANTMRTSMPAKFRTGGSDRVVSLNFVFTTEHLDPRAMEPSTNRLKNVLLEKAGVKKKMAIQTINGIKDELMHILAQLSVSKYLPIRSEIMARALLPYSLYKNMYDKIIVSRGFDSAEKTKQMITALNSDSDRVSRGVLRQALKKFDKQEESLSAESMAEILDSLLEDDHGDAYKTLMYRYISPMYNISDLTISSRTDAEFAFDVSFYARLLDIKYLSEEGSATYLQNNYGLIEQLHKTRTYLTNTFGLFDEKVPDLKAEPGKPGARGEQIVNELFRDPAVTVNVVPSSFIEPEQVVVIDDVYDQGLVSTYSIAPGGRVGIYNFYEHPVHKDQIISLYSRLKGINISAVEAGEVATYGLSAVQDLEHNMGEPQNVLLRTSHILVSEVWRESQVGRTVFGEGYEIKPKGKVSKKYPTYMESIVADDKHRSKSFVNLQTYSILDVVYPDKFQSPVSNHRRDKDPSAYFAQNCFLRHPVKASVRTPISKKQQRRVALVNCPGTTLSERNATRTPFYLSTKRDLKNMAYEQIDVAIAAYTNSQLPEMEPVVASETGQGNTVTLDMGVLIPGLIKGDDFLRPHTVSKIPLALSPIGVEAYSPVGHAVVIEEESKFESYTLEGENVDAANYAASLYNSGSIANVFVYDTVDYNDGETITRKGTIHSGMALLDAYSETPKTLFRLDFSENFITRSPNALIAAAPKNQVKFFKLPAPASSAEVTTGLDSASLMRANTFEHGYKGHKFPYFLYVKERELLRRGDAHSIPHRTGDLPRHIVTPTYWDLFDYGFQNGEGVVTLKSDAILSEKNITTHCVIRNARGTEAWVVTGIPIRMVQHDSAYILVGLYNDGREGAGCPGFHQPLRRSGKYDYWSVKTPYGVGIARFKHVSAESHWTHPGLDISIMILRYGGDLMFLRKDNGLLFTHKMRESQVEKGAGTRTKRDTTQGVRAMQEASYKTANGQTVEANVRRYSGMDLFRPRGSRSGGSN